MALGSGNSYQQSSGNYNNNQNSQNNGVYSANYYSRFRIRNYETNLDLSFGFWNGVMNIAITDYNSSSDGKANELAKIYMSPMKSKMFAECVNRIIITNDNNAYGVDTGSGETRGLIAIGRDVDKVYLVIAKVSKDGTYQSFQKFYFNNNYNYLMQFTDLDNLKFAKEYQNETELIQLKNLLEDFARSSNGAYAATAADLNRYEAAKMYNMVKATMDAVGGKLPSYKGNNSNYQRGDGFFSKNDGGNNYSQRQNKYQTVDSIEDDFA